MKNQDLMLIGEGNKLNQEIEKFLRILDCVWVLTSNTSAVEKKYGLRVRCLKLEKHSNLNSLVRGFRLLVLLEEDEKIKNEIYKVAYANGLSVTNSGNSIEQYLMINSIKSEKLSNRLNYIKCELTNYKNYTKILATRFYSLKCELTNYKNYAKILATRFYSFLESILILSLGKFFNFPFIFLCLILVGLFNGVPDGYILANGDFVAQHDPHIYIQNAHKIWSSEGNGYFEQAYPSYGIGLILAYVSILLSSSIANFPTVIATFFLIGSFTSMYVSYPSLQKMASSGVKCNDVNNFYRLFVSLAYTFNPFTFSAFYSIWAYGFFLMPYIFFPLLITQFLLVFDQERKINSVFSKFFLVSLLFSMTVTNFGFLYAAALTLFFLGVCVLFLARNFRRSLILTLKAAVTFLAATSWSWIPVLLAFKMGVAAENFNLESNFSSSMVDKKNWIIDHSFSILGWLSMSFHPQHLYFQYPLVIFGSVLLIFGVIINVFDLIRKNNINPFTIKIFILIVMLTFIGTKGSFFLSEELRSNIFTSSILYPLRSIHKTMIYLPFCLIAFFCMPSKQNKIVLCLMAFSSFFYFAQGGMTERFHFSFSNGQDYKSNSVNSPLILKADIYPDILYVNHSLEENEKILLTNTIFENKLYGIKKIDYLKYRGTSNPGTFMFPNKLIEFQNIIEKESFLTAIKTMKTYEDQLLIIKYLLERNIKYLLVDRQVEFSEFAELEFLLTNLTKNKLLQIELVSSKLLLFKIPYPNKKLFNIEYRINTNKSLFDEINHLDLLSEQKFKDLNWSRGIFGNYYLSEWSNEDGNILRLNTKYSNLWKMVQSSEPFPLLIIKALLYPNVNSPSSIVSSKPHNNLSDNLGITPEFFVNSWLINKNIRKKDVNNFHVFYLPELIKNILIVCCVMQGMLFAIILFCERFLWKTKAS